MEIIQLILMYNIVMSSVKISNAREMTLSMHKIYTRKWSFVTTINFVLETLPVQRKSDQHNPHS